MGSILSNDQCWEIIHDLANKYPAVFSLDSKRIRPLLAGIFIALTKDLGIVPDSLDGDYVRYALHAYRSRRSYVFAVAMGVRRINLAGEATVKISESERYSARSRLLKMGIWTDQHEKIFKAYLANYLSSLNFHLSSAGEEA